MGPVVGYGCTHAGALATIGGDTQEDFIIPSIRTNSVSFMDYLATDDTDYIAEQWPTTGMIHAILSNNPGATHSLQYAVIEQGIEPGCDIVAAGIATTTTDNPFTVALEGVQQGDIVNVCHGSVNAAPRTIAAVISSNDQLTITLSGAPTAGDKVNYVVWRPRGGFKPSHYIAYADLHTTVADVSAPYTAAITIAGALATDIPIIQFNGSDDTDTLILATAAAGSITATLSANPGTTHILAYMVLRAY